MRPPKSASTKSQKVFLLLVAPFLYLCLSIMLYSTTPFLCDTRLDLCVLPLRMDWVEERGRSNIDLSNKAWTREKKKLKWCGLMLIWPPCGTVNKRRTSWTGSQSDGDARGRVDRDTNTFHSSISNGWWIADAWCSASRFSRCPCVLKERERGEWHTYKGETGANKIR